MLPAFDFLRAYISARSRFSRLTEGDISAFQDAMARRRVRDAVAHSPFFAELWRGRDLDDWRTLPTTDKAAMMGHFDRYNTRGVALETAMATALTAEKTRDYTPTLPGTNLSVGLSSGTTGARGLFLVSPSEQASWAGAILARGLPGPLLRHGGWDIALFHRAGGNLYERLSGRAVRFRLFDLATPILDAVVALNARPPHLLVGPPTQLARLADEARAGRLKIRPEHLLSVAEAIEPQDAQAIADAFGLPGVGQIYQCTEGLLAISCPHLRLHLQEDIVAVQAEALGENRFTPIVTDLWRTTQPILRYRLGDVVSFDDRSCPCGSRFRVLSRIEGRKDDLCRFLARETGTPITVFPDTLRRAILLASDKILDYAIVQHNDGAATVHLSIARNESFAAVRQAVAAELDGALSALGCRAGDWRFSSELPAPEPGTPWRKRRRVVRVRN